MCAPNGGGTAQQMEQMARVGVGRRGREDDWRVGGASKRVFYSVVVVVKANGSSAKPVNHATPPFVPCDLRRCAPSVFARNLRHQRHKPLDSHAPAAYLVRLGTAGQPSVARKGSHCG